MLGCRSKPGPDHAVTGSCLGAFVHALAVEPSTLAVRSIGEEQ